MNTTAELIQLPGAELWWLPRWLSDAGADEWFAALQEETPWQQSRINLAGKSVAIPRLEAWYGDPGARYQYSGKSYEPLPFTPLLCRIKTQLEHTIARETSLSGITFNSVLLNCYRDGQDSVGWHADDEPELGKRPVIGSVSLGDSRRFLMRRKRKREMERRELLLSSGSLLVMAGDTQANWLHSVPKTRKPVGARINLTFRHIVIT